MNGNNIFIDTNTAIYLLNGDETLAGILNQKRLYISFITQLELLAYPDLLPEEEKQIELMLENCIIIDINNKIKSEIIRQRKKYKLKLPDCIVAATAIYMDIPIVTSDKELRKIEELKLMFYEK